jgi:hypothetical protein
MLDCTVDQAVGSLADSQRRSYIYSQLVVLAAGHGHQEFFLENQGFTPVPFQTKRNRTVTHIQQLTNISLQPKETRNRTSSAKDRAKSKTGWSRTKPKTPS